MVAGEASGDMLAALLMSGLRQRWPGLQPFGIGGPQMVAQGFDAWWPHDRLAVHGYTDAMRHYPEIAGIRRKLAARLIAVRPAAFVGIDAPDFNLQLEARLKALGVKAIHFVCPSIWAWRADRVHTMARSVDHVLCLFPFEPALLQRAGVPATYVGHPLADVIPMVPPRAAARQTLGLADGDTVVAVLPGSRPGEIRHIAAPFLQAVAMLHRRRGDLRFVVPVAAGQRAALQALIAAHAGEVPLQLLDGRSHEALAACDVTLIAAAPPRWRPHSSSGRWSSATACTGSVTS
jgi:lipid-A-disaccharide synthase